MTSPVIATSTGMPFIADHSRATSASASGERAALERRGHRRLDRAARLGQALAGEPLGVVEVPVAVVRPIARLLGRLELGDDADQALGDGVVDLARHALPLVEHARLAGLGQQLGVEAGVLDRRRLEPGERLPALLVLLGHPLADDTPPPITTVWMTMIAR